MGSGQNFQLRGQHKKTGLLPTHRQGRQRASVFGESSDPMGFTPQFKDSINHGEQHNYSVTDVLAISLCEMLTGFIF